MRTAEIEANAARNPEEGAVGDEQGLGFFEMGGRVVDGEAAAVEPREVGGLDLRDHDAGEFRSDEVGDRVPVLPQVGKELLSPWFSVAVGGLSRVIREAVDLGERVTTGGGESPAQRSILDDGKGVAEAGDVVGFRGREEDDEVRTQVIGEAEGTEEGSFLLVENQVAVDLVGHEDESVTLAELGDLDHLMAGEGSPEWILRLAEKEDPGLCGDGFFHPLEVEFPAAVGPGDVGDDDGFHLRVFGDTKEGRVDRRAGHDRITRLAESPCAQ